MRFGNNRKIEKIKKRLHLISIFFFIDIELKKCPLIALRKIKVESI